MGIIKNNILANTKNYIMEAYEADNMDSIVDKDIIDDFDSTYLHVPDLIEDIFYSAESVSLYKIDDEYVVEADILAKFAESNKIDTFEEAIEAIAEANSILPSEIAVVIESADVYNTIINEAKTTTDPREKSKKLNGVKDATAFLKGAKNKGLKVYKKK